MDRTTKDRTLDPHPAKTAEVYAAKYYPPPAVKSPCNALGDPQQNLQTFTLADVAQYTREGTYSNDASAVFHLFYIGRDDVHDILKHVLSRVTISLYLNMFGYDDDELNNILMAKALDPTITMLITLDKSQSGGKHEAALLQADKDHELAQFNTHFVIGESLTHQISHTKGFVADGKIAGEGSTNWSTAGEGTFVLKGMPGGRGFKAQNNTQSIFTDRDTIIRFVTELVEEHTTAAHQVNFSGQLINKHHVRASTNGAALAPARAQHKLRRVVHPGVRAKRTR